MSRKSFVTLTSVDVACPWALRRNFAWQVRHLLLNFQWEIHPYPRPLRRRRGNLAFLRWCSPSCRSFSPSPPYSGSFQLRRMTLVSPVLSQLIFRSDYLQKSAKNKVLKWVSWLKVNVNVCTQVSWRMKKMKFCFFRWIYGKCSRNVTKGLSHLHAEGGEEARISRKTKLSSEVLLDEIIWKCYVCATYGIDWQWAKGILYLLNKLKLTIPLSEVNFNLCK